MNDALNYLYGVRFVNYSGQIVEQNRDGADRLIVCEIGCSCCSEVPGKRADEYAEAIVSLLNAAGEIVSELAAYEQSVIDALDSVQDEMRAGAHFENPMLAVAARIALAKIKRMQTGK